MNRASLGLLMGAAVLGLVRAYAGEFWPAAPWHVMGPISACWCCGWREQGDGETCC